MIADAPWSVSNQTLHEDLRILFVQDVITEHSAKHHEGLELHSNPLLQPLLEFQADRRLKRNWLADLRNG